jgi:thiol-disulfide isomerase/thioredoxin
MNKHQIILNDLQERAAFKGGKCLSKEYINNSTPLLWSCKKGHTWDATSASIKQGSWCPACAGKIIPTIEDMMQIAQNKGGKCLSKKYISSRTPLIWQCKEGHSWKATAANIKHRTWCPVCAGNIKPTIKDIKAIAQSKNGKLLSKKYTDNKAPLLWQCFKKHTWQASYGSVRQGHWCPVCADIKRKDSIEDMQQIAKSRGGRCLSKEYINSISPLLWRCEKGHTWETVPSAIKQGRWCPACAGRKKHTIDDMKELAKSRGGKFLSKKYINSHIKHSWQCKEGHSWEAIPKSILKGFWCAECSGCKKLTIEQMQHLAKSRRGKCLSEKYTNSQTALSWQCKRGHTWKARPGNVVTGTWCPHCARIEKGITTRNIIRSLIPQMQELAQSKGGKCLSKIYINNSNPLIWQCKERHTWSASSNVIKKGKWCPRCFRTSQNIIEQMQQLARNEGGKCLSEEYIDNITHLFWECKEGHTWRAVPAEIKRGSWCPDCAGFTKLTIEQMQELAKSKGGKCLSKEYINSYTKLNWQCKEGHIWQATPSGVRNSYRWCPICTDKIRGYYKKEK